MNFRKSRARSRRNSMNVISNTEKWRTYAKRTSKKGELMAEDTDDDEPKYNEMKDWVQEFFNRQSETSIKVDQDVEVQLTRKQTIILSTLLPDEILLMDKFNELDPKRFVGVLLMADVSGFTVLSERYNNAGKGGTYRLTVTLNTYIGALVELIYSHGGDILKFAGDAFLALWKTDKRSFISHTIHTVIACALVIQQSYSSYETDVKVSLRVKLAISAGNLIFAPIGTGIDMNYVIFGLPVLEAKLAESLCASGEVKLTPNAWAHCYSRNYDHVMHSDGHVTIKAILYDPHEKDVTKPFLGFGPLIKQTKRNFTAIENLSDNLWDSSGNLSAADTLKKNEALGLRKSILLAEDKNIGSEIRKFMIRPVLTQIDAHQPLEYLTEMRQVSILFVTLKPRDGPFLQLVTIVNNAYQITCEIVYKSMGCVNKIILFDKDIMILVVFGLRGFKHESEAKAALKCGYNVRKSLAALDGVQEVSAGITTGQVYCGVVGHPLRREFTVIGAIVNKAARLMCKFRNKVTCDEITFVKSKMSSNGFTLQPETELKGIGKVGKIYEYTEEMRVKELYDIPMTQPLLNRIDEIEYYLSWLEDSHATFRDFDALLLVGETNIGKSRLLEWMARHARNKAYHVCYIYLSTIHSATPFLALTQIINSILGIKEPIIGFAKEEKIVQLLKVYSEDLCYLNNIIKVRFAYHEVMHSQDERKRKDKAKIVFAKLISAVEDTHVIFLDDLQNLDASSWEFISLMFCSMKIFFVMSVTRGKFNSTNNWLYSVFINSNVRKIVLGALDPPWIPALACQILDVEAVPQILCDALILKCNGLPGIVESFITHLFSNGALELKKIHADELADQLDKDLVFPDKTYLHPQALDARDQKTLDELIEKNSTSGTDICIVTDKKALKTNINVQNMDALVMMQIDSLTPYQQLLLKIASVIGNVLSRTLLENIMYENNTLTTARAIKRLFAMRILTCANIVSPKWNIQVSSTTSTPNNVSHVETNLTCDCSFDYDAENSPDNLPKYAFCKVMKFKNKNSRKTCYELLPINQKKEFHSRIVNFLEDKRQKCPTCGGSIMVVQSVVSIEQTESFSSSTSTSKLEDNESNSSNESHNTDANHENQFRQTEHLERTQSENIQTDKNMVDVTKPISEAMLYRESVNNSYVSNQKLQYTPILKNMPSDEPTPVHRRSTKRVTMTNLSLMKPSSEIIESVKIFDRIREVTEAEDINDWHKLGAIDSQDSFKPDARPKERTKRSFSVKIERGVSDTNVTKCTCADLQLEIYDQLIHHAIQAELKNKGIEFLITYCYLNLLCSNIDNAFPKLEEAEQMCLENKEMFNVFDKKRYMGKIYSLRAAACMMSGRITGAKIELDRALKIYQISLDKVTGMLTMKNIFRFFKVKREKYRLFIQLIKADSVFCLNVATLLYSSLGDDRISKLTAFKALDIVQNAECPFVDMCDAYTNAIQIELDRGMPDSTADIEKLATISLQNMARPIYADELYAVGKLFLGSFRARIARGQLPNAIHSGFRALTVSRFLQADNIALDLIPDLFYILLARRRIEEAIDVLKLASKLNQHNVTDQCETWYYALCIDMILDAGFQLESPDDISRFAEFSLNSGRAGGASRRRLVVGLWTYWLRADSEKKARRFESEALSWSSSDEDDGSLTTLMSAMRLAEGMLESLARKVDDLKKVVDLMELRSIADRELTRLESDARLMRALYPRWMFLKANSLKLSGRVQASSNTFNQVIEDSRRIHNRLEESLALAALSNSVFWAQSARVSCFMHWRAGAEHARTSWHQLMYKITTSRQ